MSKCRCDNSVWIICVLGVSSQLAADMFVLLQLHFERSSSVQLLFSG
jgi:hypothetical protein